MSHIQKVERLFYIINYLNNHETVTAEVLAKDCKTSVRSIYRDMKELEKLGFFYINEGKKGYRLIDQPVKQLTHLTFDEWMAFNLFPVLMEKAISIEHPFHHAYRSGLEKIGRTFNRTNQYTHDSADLSERIFFHATDIHSFPPEIMSAIIEAVVKNRTVQITYYSIHRNTLTDRMIDPYYLVSRSGNLYLIAYCHYRQNVLVFRLSRIRAIEIKEQHSFTIPKEFSINEFLANRWSIFAEDSEPTCFVVRFKKEVARYIYEYDFYTDTLLEEQEDGSLLLKTTVKSKTEFIRWIRSYGLNAEVIEPVKVREQLKLEYEQMSNQYR